MKTQGAETSLLRRDAFTVRDLLGCLAAVFLLAAVAAPTLGNVKVRSDRAVCASNLGIIGRAFNQWAFSHDGLYPVYVNAPIGTKNSVSRGNAYELFRILTNELTSFAVLACPADRSVRPVYDATPFSPLDNNGISYFLGWPRPHEGRLLLSGDYHIAGATLTAGSPTGINPTVLIPKDSPNIRWAPGYHHPDAGNLLFNDGSVEWTDNSRLREVIQSYPDTVEAEFLFPRTPPIYPRAPGL